MEKELNQVFKQNDVLALAFGAMIGWGWVVLTGPMIQQAGSCGVVIGLIVGGLISVLIGLVYAELTAALPRTGGSLAFVFLGLNSTTAWVTGWSLILAYLSIVFFEAVALPSALTYLIPEIQYLPIWKIAGEPVYGGWVLLGPINGSTVNWY